MRAPVYSHVVYDIVPGEETGGPPARHPDPRGAERAAGRPRGRASSCRDYFDFSIYVDAEEADVERWYVERFLTLRETVFHDPQRRTSTTTPTSATTRPSTPHVGIWAEINGKNLVGEHRADPGPGLAHPAQGPRPPRRSRCRSASSDPTRQDVWDAACELAGDHGGARVWAGAVGGTHPRHHAGRTGTRRSRVTSWYGARTSRPRMPSRSTRHRRMCGPGSCRWAGTRWLVHRRVGRSAPVPGELAERHGDRPRAAGPGGGRSRTGRGPGVRVRLRGRGSSCPIVTWSSTRPAPAARSSRDRFGAWIDWRWVFVLVDLETAAPGSCSGAARPGRPVVARRPVLARSSCPPTG